MKIDTIDLTITRDGIDHDVTANVIAVYIDPRPWQETGDESVVEVDDTVYDHENDLYFVLSPDEIQLAEELTWKRIRQMQREDAIDQ